MGPAPMSACDGSGYLPSRRTLSPVQGVETIFTRTSVLGRLVAFAIAGGVLAAAMVIPVVAATGVLVRNEADKFTTLSLSSAGLPQRSQILDRYGHLLAYVYGVDVPYDNNNLHYFGWNREPVGYQQISPNMANAVVAIEDSRYWQHGAIDLRGTIRAAVNDFQHKPVQGGSTIAQQYVKNVLLLEAEKAENSQALQAANAETLSRKLNELRMAVAAEHQQSKQDILAGYLNNAYFGNLAYGIETAAETYFGISAAKLSITQAATLAGIVENPSAYDPVKNPALALTRRNTVLARMAQTNNGLTAAQAAAEEAKPLGLKFNIPDSGCQSSSVGSGGFFCQYVEEVFLHDPAYGKTPMERAKMLSTGGLKIYTTLNPQDQQAANTAVNYVEPGNSKYWNPGHNADTEAVVQPGTGQIMAIAENRPYGTGHGQTEISYAVNTAYGGSAGVQTGSSSKLFTLITALKQGMPFGATMHAPGSTTVTGYTNCQGGPAGVLPGPGRRVQRDERGRTAVRLQPVAVHRHRPVRQRVLRRARAEGRALQRGAHRGQHGPDPGRRHLAAQARRQPGFRRQHPLVHAGLGQRRPAVHGGRVRDGRGARHVLRARRHRQDPRQHRQEPVRAVGQLPPGLPRGGRRRRELYPAGRPDQRHRGAHRRPGRPAGGGQDRYLQRRGRRRHPVRRLRAATRPAWWATSRCSTPSPRPAGR